MNQQAGGFMKKLEKLTTKGLKKSFGDFEVLNDFNLTVEKGEFVTFLGPSGCGKSTALNCICGLIPITGGEIYIDDTCIDNAKNICVPPEKRGFGIVFQNYALFPHLTVFRNVAFGLELKRMEKSKIREKVAEAISIVHLEGFEDKYPGQLSGGQQQRVAIARCIVLEPLLLMLDEPLSNLDAKLRLEMRHELKALHEDLHIATIYVTHDQGEALALSDKIVVMKRGLVQQIGSPSEIYADPANLFVADFMGFKNQWEAKITNLTESGNFAEMKLDVKGMRLLSKKMYKKHEEAKLNALKRAFETGQTVVTGIRPDDFEISSDSQENTYACMIELVSYVGNSNEATGTLSNGLLTDAKVEVPVARGQKVDVHIPPDKVQLFVREE